MITYAILNHGRPRMADFTNPSSTLTVNAGDVVVDGATLRICHTDIMPLKLGALAMEGGTYALPKATTTGSAIPDGTDVYWDATNHVVTASSNSGANLKLGTTEASAGDSASTILVLHKSN